ncbi:hypothetical protein DOE63_20795 [Salmonella enterica subsp. diarizonae serovar 59:z10:-]|nr:hypothetical protein DOE63_20795 [Salmonella enterica subsp. diarizonae serovar 59:z10:-]
MLTDFQGDAFGMGFRCRGLIKSIRVDGVTSLISSRPLSCWEVKNFPHYKEGSSNRLQSLICLAYAYSAPYKTGAGVRSPISKKATPDAASVFFVVRYTRHSMAWCAYLMTNSPQAFDHATAHRAALIMVTLTGQPQGWPVSFLPGTSNPVNVTAPIKIRSLSGDSLTSKKEAVYHG